MKNLAENTITSNVELPLPNYTKLYEITNMVVFSCVVDDECKLKYISDNVLSYGYSSAEFMNNYLDYKSIIHEDDIHRVLEKIKLSLQDHIEKFSILHRIITKDANIKWINVSFLCEYNHDGVAIDVCGAFNDVTHIIQQENQANLLAQALEQSDKMVFIADKNGIISYVNDSLVQHSGYSKNELIGARTNIFKSGEHTSEFYKQLWDTILSDQSYNNILINRKKSGELYYIDLNITPVRDKYSHAQSFVATSKDVTIQVKLEHKLENLAIRDSLTHVYNRYKINTEIELEIARAKRNSIPFSILMFDIDDFKKVNDTYGHYVGDKVLIDLTKLIEANIREVDTFGRWGGEEFMLILDNTTRNKAFRVAEKIRQSIEGVLFAGNHNITVSIGVSQYKTSEQKSTFFQRVDSALYKAKNDGKNRVVAQ